MLNNVYWMLLRPYHEAHSLQRASPCMFYSHFSLTFCWYATYHFSPNWHISVGFSGEFLQIFRESVCGRFAAFYRIDIPNIYLLVPRFVQLYTIMPAYDFKCGILPLGPPRNRYWLDGIV